MKKWTLLLAGVLSAFASYSQVIPPGYYVDGFDYPFGNGGYALDGITEIIYTEDITPEINNLYPDNPTTNPDRMCLSGCGSDDGWYNAGDVGEYRVGTKGIHGGDDENYVFGDEGLPVKAVANGQVVGIFSVNMSLCEWGWIVVVKHYYDDGNFYHSVYKHVTTADNTDGTICPSATDFSVAVGDWVMRGDIIARIASGFCNPSNHSHLHYEIRDSNLDFPFNGGMLSLHPRDNGKQAYGGEYCPTACASSGFEVGGISAEETDTAYMNMRLDGIIDASDFIETHRPSFYAETPCYDPPIAWQNTIGGSGIDYLYAMDKTLDGGYIIAGSSTSNISGDKTENIVDGTAYSDYWVVKLDSLGNIEWQNTIGGSAGDNAFSVIQTSDGGYMVGGLSASGATGDKIESALSADYWILKLSSVGDIVWQNTLGGDSYDYCTVVQETFDGGYIIGGHSSSNISGDKTENTLGDGPDYWIIKLDPAGNVEWDNTIGGDGEDELKSLEQTDDGGYILGGWSASNISGDKTENCLGVYDYWVLKLDSVGNIEWQNTLGGTDVDKLTDIKQSSDGGYIVGGYSESNISDDKTENVIGYMGFGYGLADYWIVKLNPSGEIEWDNTIGGTHDDMLSKVIETTDGGFAAVGSSRSNISGDKAENNIPGVGYDYWIIKLGSAGNIEWQNTIGGGDFDQAYGLVQNSDGDYTIAGYSNSGIYGDKTEASQGNYDYWIVNLSCEIPCDPETIAISASGPTTFCQGGSVNLNATYSGATVQWKKDGTDILGATSSTYTVNQKGTYTATTTGDCGSATSSEIVVTVQKNPIAGIIAGGPTTFCSGGSVVLTANAGAGLSYQWYKGATPIAGATGINYTATLAGNYRCQVTKVSTGCSKLSTTITVSVPCKIDLSEMNEIVVYPNPASDVFYVQTDESACKVVVSNMIGQIIYENPVYQNEAISVHGWSSGIYLVTISSNQGTKTIQTVVE